MEFLRQDVTSLVTHQETKNNIYIYIYIYIYRGTRWPGWLRHRATSRMVAGSTLDGVT